MIDKSPEVLKAIQTYQVPGCVSEFDPENFPQEGPGVEWSGHTPGTMMTTPNGLMTLFLGMPTGFNRVGVVPLANFKIKIFKSMDHKNQTWPYNKFNVPVWKHLDEHGNTLVRGMAPRINLPFIHIILGDVRDQIDCLEITAEDIADMD